MTNLLAVLAAAGLFWASERAAALKAYQAKEYPAFRAHLQKQLEATFATPALLYKLAAAEALLGHREAALGFLGDWARTGSTAAGPGSASAASALLQDPDLASLQPFPAPLLAQLEENRKPIAKSQVVFTLPDADLLVEDLAYDPPSRTFFVSSVREGKIVAFKPGGAARDFARPPGGHGSVLALGVDQGRRLLWATTAAMAQTPRALGVRKEDLGHTALLAFDLATGALRETLELPPGAGGAHLLGDLTVAPDGTVFVTDSLSGVVYRARGKGLEVLTQAGIFQSPQTPALSPDGFKLFVPDYARGVAEIDLRTSRVSWLVHPRDLALTGIDGLYLYQGALIAVQNGTAPMRVGRFQLDPALRRAQAYAPIEMNTPRLGSPTHGVIVGNQFFYIGNSGWERASDSDDSFKPGGPAVILRAEL